MQDSQRPSTSCSSASSSSSTQDRMDATSPAPRGNISPERQARRAAALQRRREQNRLAQARRRQRSDTLLNELQDDVHRLRKQLEARDQFIARLKAGKVASSSSSSLSRPSSSSSDSMSDNDSGSSRKHARSSSVSSDNSSLDSILDSHAALQANAFMAAGPAMAPATYPAGATAYLMQQQQHSMLSPPASPTLVYDAATDTCMPASTTAWVTAQQAVMGAWDHSHHDHFTSAALTAAAAASCFMSTHDDHAAGLSSPSFYAGSEVATPMTPLTPISPCGMRPTIAHQRAVSDSILPVSSRPAFAPVADANASPRTWQALLQQLSVSTPPQAAAAAQTPLWDASMPSVLRPVM